MGLQARYCRRLSPAGHSLGRFYLRGFSFPGFRRRTPGPPPFSSMNSTPAASKAWRNAASFASVIVARHQDDITVAHFEYALRKCGLRPPNNSVAIEVVRRNAFNRFAEAQKLSLALGRQRATLACKLVHSGAAYLTRDCLVLIQQRKFKGHPVRVVTQNPAPHERHLDHPRICMLEKCVVFVSLSRGRASGSGPY